MTYSLLVPRGAMSTASLAANEIGKASLLLHGTMHEYQGKT